MSRPAPLQTRLADPRHYPSGASKWNPIDHRLFSEISKNWAGHPLRSYQTILNHIRTTTTDTGLCVTAQLVDQEYPKGVKISDAQFASIELPDGAATPSCLFVPYEVQKPGTNGTNADGGGGRGFAAGPARSLRDAKDLEPNGCRR